MIPNDALSRTRCKRSKHRFWKEAPIRNANVFRESTRGNWNQKTSILRKRHLESTMSRFHHDEIHARGYDSSTDPEVKASFGRLAATCRLLKPRSVFLVVYVGIEDRNKPTFCLIQFVHDFLHRFYHPVRYCIGRLEPAD
jgi:hypothetical protein